MKKSKKIKRWIGKNILGIKSNSGRPKQVLQVQEQPTQQPVVYQKQSPLIQFGGFNMGSNSNSGWSSTFTILGSLLAVGLAVSWFNDHFGQTATLILVAFVAGIMVLGIVALIVLAVQRNTTNTIQELSRNDAMVDRYRKQTELETLKIQRIERQQELHVLRQQPKMLTQNSQIPDEDEEQDVYDWSNIKYQVHE